MGKAINSQQFLIANDDLGFNQGEASSLSTMNLCTRLRRGVSYEMERQPGLSSDLAFRIGLKVGFRERIVTSIPIFPSMSGTFTTFHPSRRDQIQLRFDIINLFDEVYQLLHDGTGIGASGGPQFGQRRTFLVGLAYQF